MVVPTDLQVRLERFAALRLPLRACTVSTGVERCQRKCTRARFLAGSGTLEFCRRFRLETTLEQRLSVRSRPSDGRGAGRGRRGRWRRRGRRGGRRRLLRWGGGRLEAAGRGPLGQPQVEVGGAG